MIRRKLGWGLCWVALECMLAGVSAVAQVPPFGGTVYVDRDIIRPDDWSSHESLSYSGIFPRYVFDRRDDAFSTKDMHIFTATFTDGPAIEVQVNSIDFASDEAQGYAASYAADVGQLPPSLRADVETMSIHDGNLPFGGGNNSILVHVDVDVGIQDFLEEILFHEATHATYGPAHDNAPGWRQAQDDDPTFISDYALQYPDGEDVAESLLMWYAVRYRSYRLEASTITSIEAAIPNRLAYFDALPFVDSMPPVIGDYNNDGTVNAADYVVWRNNLATNNPLPNDPIGGTIGPEQYEQWRTRFGQSGGSAAGDSFVVTAPVPETSTVILGFLGSAGHFLARRRPPFRLRRLGTR